MKPLGDLKAKRLIADGESQSAIRMTTYVNAIQPLTKRFDGFMIHSRFASAAPISQAPLPAIAGVSPARIRTDQTVPVMVFLAETDVLGHLAARQPDSKHYRLWEVPGTSHVDKYMLGPVGLAGLNCALPVNDGPQHYVFNAALRSLNKWIRNDAYVPPKAPRIWTDANGAIIRDQHGNARGGIRTPQLDVPVKLLLGTGNSPAFCGLAGTSTPFDAATLAALYPTRADYLNAYVYTTLDALNRKFVLGDDFVPIIAEALESAGRRLTAERTPAPPALSRHRPSVDHGRHGVRPTEAGATPPRAWPSRRARDTSGRPTRWGNPYVWRPGELRAGAGAVRDRAEALARYEADLRGDPAARRRRPRRAARRRPRVLVPARRALPRRRPAPRGQRLTARVSRRAGPPGSG